MWVPFLVGEVVMDRGAAVVGDKLHVGGEAASSCGVVVVGGGGLLIVGLLERHCVVVVVDVGGVCC